MVCKDKLSVENEKLAQALYRISVRERSKTASNISWIDAQIAKRYAKRLKEIRQ